MKNTLLKSASVIDGKMRSPKKVMRFSRMGSSFQTKHSFMPILTRIILKRCSEDA
jgi:hypothetical protein